MVAERRFIAPPANTHHHPYIFKRVAAWHGVRVQHLRVEEGKLFRGSQPTAEEIENLKHNGVKTIVKVNTADLEMERTKTGELGIRLHVVAHPTIAPLLQRPSEACDTQWVLFTSGTTGVPKMVVHTRAGLTALRDMADAAFVSSTDLPFLPPAFVRSTSTSRTTTPRPGPARPRGHRAALEAERAALAAVSSVAGSRTS